MIGPGSNLLFAERDSIEIEINDHLRDLAGYPPAQPLTETYLTGALVYPGDANHDGYVDERDILAIGANFGRSGPTRATPGMDWAPQSVHVLTATSAWEPWAAVYADADGSGTVDADDVCAVSNNFGRTWLVGDSTSGRPRPGVDISLSVDSRIVDQMRIALADCAESAGKDILTESLQGIAGGLDTPLPTSFALHQNYPNPFNAGTMISFDLPQSTHVTLSIYNLVGQRVAILVDGVMPSGRNDVGWDGRGSGGAEVASGVYFYRLEMNDRVVSRRMMLLK
jgi:hypothetical protein